MSDFNLARESCEEQLDYNVIVSEFENGAEERRLKNLGAVLGFKIKSPQLTYAQMQSYRNFIISKYGALTEFTFTSPFDSTEYNVRFVPQTFNTVYESGSFQCSFEFKVC
jgi:hypothetical protein